MLSKGQQNNTLLLLTLNSRVKRVHNPPPGEQALTSSKKDPRAKRVIPISTFVRTSSGAPIIKLNPIIEQATKLAHTTESHLQDMSKESPTPTFIDKALIAEFLPENPVIIEAGAHIGRDTLRMATQWPYATIHAFEPIPESFAKLTANTASISSIHLYPYALASVTGSATLYQGSNKQVAASSLLKPGTYWDERTYATFTPLIVPTISLADFALKYNITHADFLWLDLQGAELEILKSAGTLLETVSVIHTEVNLVERYHGAPLYPEVRAWLEMRGFKLQAEALNTLGWGNALFVRST